jgi:hypothetical protein
MRSRIIFAVALLAALFTISTVGSASAAPVNPSGSGAVRQAVVITNSSQVAPDALDGSDIKPLWVGDFAPSAWAQILGVPYNTVGKPQLKQEVADELAYGKSGLPTTIAPKIIEHLGGPYFGADLTTPADDQFTTLGEVQLGKGTWLVNVSGTFHRTAAGVVGSRPQIGLRIGQDQTAGAAKWGIDAGTIGGVEISPGNGHDLFGSSTKVITLTGPTTIGVYGFGYNNDTGTAGSGQIEASAVITPVQVG